MPQKLHVDFCRGEFRGAHHGLCGRGAFLGFGCGGFDGLRPGQEELIGSRCKQRGGNARDGLVRHAFQRERDGLAVEADGADRGGFPERQCREFRRVFHGELNSHRTGILPRFFKHQNILLRRPGVLGHSFIDGQYPYSTGEEIRRGGGFPKDFYDSGMAFLRGEGFGGIAIDIPERGIGPALEQERNGFGLPFGGGPHERGKVFVAIDGVDLGAVVEKELNGFGKGSAGGKHERGGTAFVPGIDIGTCGDEFLDNTGLAVEGGIHERGAVARVARIDFIALHEGFFDGFDFAVERRLNHFLRGNRRRFWGRFFSVGGKHKGGDH